MELLTVLAITSVLLLPLLVLVGIGYAMTQARERREMRWLERISR